MRLVIGRFLARRLMAILANRRYHSLARYNSGNMHGAGASRHRQSREYYGNGNNHYHRADETGSEQPMANGIHGIVSGPYPTTAL